MGRETNLPRLHSGKAVEVGLEPRQSSSESVPGTSKGSSEEVKDFTGEGPREAGRTGRAVQAEISTLYILS